MTPQQSRDRAESMNRLGLGEFRRQDLPSALSCFEEAQGIDESLGDLPHLQMVLGNKGLVLMHMGRFDEAMEVHLQEERICRSLPDEAGLQACLGSQALVLMGQGLFMEAMGLVREKVRLCRRLHDPRGLHIGLNMHAHILISLGRFEMAARLLDRQERMCRKLDDHENLCKCLRDKGQCQFLLFAFELARECFLESERIARKIGANTEAERLAQLAAALVLGTDRDEVEKARILLETAEETLRRWSDQARGLATLTPQARRGVDLCAGMERSANLFRQAELCFLAGDPEEADVLLDESLKACRVLKLPSLLCQCLLHHAMVRWGVIGDLCGAAALVGEAYTIAKEAKSIRLIRKSEAVIRQMEAIVRD